MSPEMRMQEAMLIKKSIAPRKRTNQHSSGTVIDRFERMVAIGSSDCWYWTGSVNRLGYGVFVALNETKAHRVAYKLFHGSIPNGMFVLHKCDTRCCVNPSHLMLGTQTDNMRDMAKKGRCKSIPLPGEKNPQAKLTAFQVQEIRSRVQNGETQKSMCAIFNVSPMTISRVVRGETWK